MLFESGDTIVFAGDSVTDMGSEYPVGRCTGEQLGRSYVRVIDSLLAATYPELKLNIVNAEAIQKKEEIARKRAEADRQRKIDEEEKKKHIIVFYHYTSWQ